MHSNYKAAGCQTVVRLTESAFPILSVPGFWEMFKQRRADQVNRRVRADLDAEALNHWGQHSAWNYTIVPWED